MNRLLLITLSCFVALDAEGGEEQFVFEAPLMGTVWRVVLYTANEESARKAAADVFARVGELNLVMSDYLPESEVRQLSTESKRVSKDLIDVLKGARELAEQSGGAFDVSAGALTRVWKRALRRSELPKESSISIALKSTGWEKIEIDEEARSVRLRTKDVRIDLGGIGKGYALDAGMVVLRTDHGISRALIDAGGDVIAGDPPLGQRYWKVKVRGNGEEFFLEVHNQAVATSGDLYQGEEIGGIRYSHLVDPRDGMAQHNGAAATVLAPEGWLADGLASTLCILDAADGELLLQKRKAAARITRRLPSGVIETLDLGEFKAR